MPREKERHWCRRGMKSQASRDERQNRNHTRWRCEHAEDWCDVPKRNDQPRERRPRSHHPRCQVHSNVRCHLFFFTRPPMSASNGLKHDDIKKRGFANGFRGEPRCNETITPSPLLEFRIVQRVLTGRLQPRPSTDMVMLPSSVRTTPTAVGRLSHGIPGFYESLKQQPLHGHTTQGSCMTIRTRGPPASFGISKPVAGRMTTAFAGDPVVHGREPVPHSRAVHRSTLSARAAANHKPVPAPWHKSPAPLPRPGRPASGVVPTGASVGYGQGAV